MGHRLALLLLVACGGGARDGALAPLDPPAVAATPPAPPCAPAPALTCAEGFELTWDAPPRVSGGAAALVTRGDTSTLFWSPRHGAGPHAADRGIEAVRACAGAAAGEPSRSDPLPDPPSDALPGADDAFLVTALASRTVTVVLGVAPGGRTAHAYLPGRLRLWIDRGAGFGPPATLSATVPASVPVRAAAGADGRIAIAWFDGERTDRLRLAVVDAAGGLAATSDLGRIRYGIAELELVALPDGGWVVLQTGRGARTLTAMTVHADGGAGAVRTVVEGELGSMAATWDGDAIAIAYEVGDHGRDASPPRGGGGAHAGSIGWSARPDTHALHLLRLAPDLTPLGPPIALDPAADVAIPAALVHHDGHYWLVGASLGPPPRRPTSPQLVRLTRSGTVTHQVDLPLAALPRRATLHLHAGALRGAITSNANELRPFTLRCPTP